MIRAVLVSNGHGEDVIATAVGRRLRAHGADLVAVPLVGRGAAYEAAGVPVLGPRDAHPSGGYTLWGARAAWADVRAGLIGSTWARWRALRGAAARADLCVAVGDRYALAAARRVARAPTYFLHVAISVAAWPPDAPAWRPPFGPFERALMREARAVYPRDAVSAAWLRDHGVPNVHDLGNPMLDALEGDAPVDAPKPWVIGLPGTRADAQASLPRMLEAMRGVPSERAHLVVAWAGGDPPAPPPGWTAVATGAERGVVQRYRHDDGTAASLARGAFATLVTAAAAALSTSGTAAEQAAGLGVPVVGFATGGPQYTPAFAAAQKRALGEALTLVPDAPDAIAAALRRALDDPDLRARAARDGARAMGRPGAAERIARHLLDDHAVAVAAAPRRSP